ncbi:MAG: ABC transporter permease subunit, partial [Lachnospiraceae bacterium]|nr:ABC transporter permease subunit [Lachnospiraceae bacterium]
MVTVYKHELKTNIKSLLIWCICVGGMGLACILLFSGMKSDMEGMADTFASMGAFSDAFGMSQLSIATLSGFYAAEVGTIHGLGGAMFAAILSTVMLSKEEDGHTSEFLFSLPISRQKVVLAKWLAVLSHVILFNLLCTALYAAGFTVLGEEMPVREFLIYHGMQIVMQSELAAICFGISSFMKKNRLGIGLGIILL